MKTHPFAIATALAFAAGSAHAAGNAADASAPCPFHGSFKSPRLRAGRATAA